MLILSATVVIWLYELGRADGGHHYHAIVAAILPKTQNHHAVGKGPLRGRLKLLGSTRGARSST